MTFAATKVCSRCGADKPLEDYYKQQLAKRAPYCKLCRRAALRSRRMQQRAYVRERYSANHRQLVALKRTLACVDCGWSPVAEDECQQLHFDHVDPLTKTPVGTSSAFRLEWTWERIAAEITLCEPRCGSCHGRRTARQRRGDDPFPLRSVGPLRWTPARNTR